tara:strand:+ start:4437 stop:4904 length:468 start_codon:yes stop_codon:yes gene_type:complete
MDLKLGEDAEEKIHSYLEACYGTLLRSKDNPKMGKYYEFDKYNDKYYLEIKTRRIKHNQYPTLMFGYNKYIKGQKLLQQDPNLKIIYLWNCNDGIYYWEHDSTLFTIKKSGRCDRGKPELSTCVHIKRKDLKKLEYPEYYTEGEIDDFLIHRDDE